MLNAVWIGGSEIGGHGYVSPIIEFGATATASASATTAEVVRTRGYAASVTATTVGELTVERQKNFGAAALARALPEATLYVTKKFAAEVGAFVSGLLGLSLPRTFESQVIAQVTGILLPYDALFDGEADAAVSADPVAWNRVRHFASSATVSGSAASADGVIRYRGFAGSIAPTATQAADPDVERGGVRFAEFSSVVSARATAQETSVFSVLLGSSVSASVSAAPVTALVVRRYREMRPGLHLAQANGAVAMVVSSYLASAVTARVTTVAQIGKRLPMPVSSATARATATMARPALVPGTLRPAGRTAQATASLSGMSRRRGLAGSVFPRVQTSAADFRLAIKCSGSATVQVDATTTADAGRNISQRFGGEAAAAVTATTTEDAGHNVSQRFAAEAALSAEGAAEFEVLRVFAADSLATVSATADLSTNIFDDEPDYRTVAVPAAPFAFDVPAQPFVVSITGDRTVQSFTKQPGERLAYDIDFTDWFSELEGDDIETASVVVATASSGVVGDLTIEQPIKIGTPCYRVKVWAEDGLNGATYKLTLTINTEGGRRKQVDFRIKVKDD